MMREQSPEADTHKADESMETMVRSILREKEHPVFEEHPGADPGNNKVKKNDAPPNEERPVFREKPGKAGKGNDLEDGPDNQQNNQHEAQGNNGGNGNR